MRRISSAVGVRPKPKVGDCANAGLATSGTTVTSPIAASLGEPIGHLPVARDPPRHDAVVEPGHPVIPLLRHVPPPGDLLAQWLHLPDLVGGARHNHGLLAIPGPWLGEPDARHAWWRVSGIGQAPDLGVSPGRLHRPCRRA